MVNQHGCTLKELKLEAVKYLCCMNIAGTSIWCLQMEIFPHFLCFWGLFAFLVLFPFDVLHFVPWHSPFSSLTLSIMFLKHCVFCSLTVSVLYLNQVFCSSTLSCFFLKHCVICSSTLSCLFLKHCVLFLNTICFVLPCNSSCCLAENWSMLLKKIKIKFTDRAHPCCNCEGCSPSYLHFHFSHQSLKKFVC